MIKLISLDNATARGDSTFDILAIGRNERAVINHIDENRHFHIGAAWIALFYESSPGCAAIDLAHLPEPPASASEHLPNTLARWCREAESHFGPTPDEMERRLLEVGDIVIGLVHALDFLESIRVSHGSSQLFS